MKNLFFFLLILFFCKLSFAQSADTVLFSITDYPDGTIVDKNIAESIFNCQVSYISTGSNRLVIENKKIRFEYPVGKILHESGGEIRLNIPTSSVYTLKYTVCFKEDFDFSKGGKLPGLAGGTATSGGNQCTGDGWSAKLMWRENGWLFLYLYHYDMVSNYGEYTNLSFQCIPGESITISEKVIMNTDSNCNGIIEISVNNNLALRKKNIRFMTESNNPRIDRILFYSFFGGSTIEWAPSRTAFAYFNDILLKCTQQISGIDDSTETKKKSLSQNCPNPFNLETTINWESKICGQTALKVFDITEKLVDPFTDDYKSAGKHSLQFFGKPIPSGVYYYKLKSRNKTEIKKWL